MTLLVISDIHGSIQDLEKVLETSQKYQWDYMLLLGDFLNHGPRNPLPTGYDTKAVAALLNQYKDKIIAVRGNCDSEVDQMMLEFPCLAPFTTILAGNKRIFAHHGHLYDRQQLSSWLASGSLVLSGHTHVSLLEKDAGLIYFNPGSISIPKCERGKSFGLIQSEGETLKIQLMNLEGEEILSSSL